MDTVDKVSSRAGTVGAWNINNSAPLQIGFRYGQAYLNGVVDDVRAYNRALSTAEIQQLYKQGGGKLVNPQPILLRG